MVDGASLEKGRGDHGLVDPNIASAPCLPKPLRVLIIIIYSVTVLLPIMIIAIPIKICTTNRVKPGEHRVNSHVSVTALEVCRLRALLTGAGQLDDHYAYYFLPRVFSIAMIIMKPLWWISRIPFLDPSNSGAAVMLKGRTLMGESIVQEMVNEGNLGNIVLLGAGFDSKFQRLNIPDNVKLYEIDIKPTQEAKLAGLSRAKGAGLKLNESIVFLAVDFNAENFVDKLMESGFDCSAKTLFLWEGVTYYLNAEAVESTLDGIRTRVPNSDIYCDVSRPFDKNSKLEMSIKQKLDSIGEPFIFSVENDKVESYFTGHGFNILKLLDAKEIENVYGKFTNGQSMGSCLAFNSLLHLRAATN